MDELLQERLTTLKTAGLYRQTFSYEPVDATHVRYQDNTYLMMASNNYLGLTHNKVVQETAAAAALKYGTGSGGSRLTTGTYPLYDELERTLADFKGAEAAVVFNTGYMANVGAISALAGPDDIIFSDELNHASIIDGCRVSRAQIVVYRHNDSADLAAKLRRHTGKGLRLVVTDGVFSMDGDIAPLDDIVVVAEQYGAAVMVDDAHATGVIGPGGRGTAAHYGLKGRVAVQMGTLSKALAAEGGYIAGSRALIEYIVNKARSFIFSTALSPATVAAAGAAVKALAANPAMVEQLRDNAVFLRRRLTEAGLQVGDGETPIVPVIVGEAAAAVALAGELRQAGIIVSAIRPPTVPAGTSRLRITVSAAHTQEELAAAACQIALAASRLGILRRDG
jgi:8-amino-7-oxononanoate synthase